MNPDSPAATSESEYELLCEAIQRLLVHGAILREDYRELYEWCRLQRSNGKLDELAGLVGLKLHSEHDYRLILAVPQHLTNKNRTLAAHIERLKQTGKTVQQAVQNRARNALIWLQKVEMLPFQVESAPLAAMKFAAEQLAKTTPEQFRERVCQLAQSAGAALQAVRVAAKPSSDRHTSLEQEVIKHNAALAGAKRITGALWQLCFVWKLKAT